MKTKQNPHPLYHNVLLLKADEGERICVSNSQTLAEREKDYKESYEQIRFTRIPEDHVLLISYGDPKILNEMYFVSIESSSPTTHEIFFHAFDRLKRFPLCLSLCVIKNEDKVDLTELEKTLIEFVPKGPLC